MNESDVASNGVSLADQIVAKKASLQEAKAAIEVKGVRDHNGGWWSTNNAMTMSACVLLFGAIVMLTLLHHVKNADVTDHESRIFIIVLVIVSALFLVVAGYSDSQIAPVMGLLGTITGYVLRGVAEPAKDPVDNSQPKPEEKKP